MPEPASSTSAVIVSGGKQFRVSVGDRIVVDRIASEPGAEVKLDRVLMFSDGDGIKVLAQAAEVPVTARVVAHEKGAKVVAFRYKAKKHVRVRRGSRAALTTLQITRVGDQVEQKQTAKAAKTESKPARRRATKAAAASSSTGTADKKAGRSRTRSRKGDGDGA